MFLRIPRRNDTPKKLTTTRAVAVVSYRCYKNSITISMMSMMISIQSIAYERSSSIVLTVTLNYCYLFTNSTKSQTTQGS